MKRIISSLFITVSLLAFGINSVSASSINDWQMEIHDGTSFIPTSLTVNTDDDSFFGYDKSVGYSRAIKLDPTYFYNSGGQFELDTSFLTAPLAGKADVHHIHGTSDIIGLNSELSNRVTYEALADYLAPINFAISGKAATSSVNGLNSFIVSVQNITNANVTKVGEIMGNISGASTTMRIGYGTSTVSGFLDTAKWNAMVSAMASATSSLASLSTTVSGMSSTSLASATSSGLISSTLWSKLVALPTSFFDGTWESLTGKPTFKRQETYNGTTNGSGVYTVTFSTPYPSTPDVQPTWIGAGDTNSWRVTSVSSSSFTVLARNRTDVIGLLPSFSNVSGATIGVLVTER